MGRRVAAVLLLLSMATLVRPNALPGPLGSRASHSLLLCLPFRLQEERLVLLHPRLWRHLLIAEALFGFLSYNSAEVATRGVLRYAPPSMG